MKLVQRGKKMKQPKRETTENNEVEAQHKCTECGMVFQRRYALIMHTLKHERSKDYKCPVSLFLSVNLAIKIIFLVSFSILHLFSLRTLETDRALI